MTDLLGKPAKLQSPSVLVFDLKHDVLIRQFEIPEEQIKPDSFFVNIVSCVCADSALLNWAG